MNYKAEEVLFIDDSPQHIEGAKKLGIKTYHLLDDVVIQITLEIITNNDNDICQSMCVKQCQCRFRWG